MRPTLRQLDYIVTVARLGRFGLAAEALNVSQPSLSAQIAEAEAELGIRVFHRGRAGVTPTALGLEVIRRAHKILGDVADLKSVAQHALPFGGRLRLGVLPSIGPYLLPRVVAAIHRAQPALRVIIREESTQGLEQGLISGRLDMIISTPEDHPNTLQAHLFTEALFIAVARDDALAAGGPGPVGPDDLRQRVFLTLDRGHRLARIVYALSSACGGVVSDDYEGTSLDSIRLMAASGAGVAILPELYARRHIGQDGDVIIRPLAMPQASRDIALLQPVRDQVLAGTELLRDALLAEARNLGLGQPPGSSSAKATI